MHSLVEIDMKQAQENYPTIPKSTLQSLYNYVDYNVPTGGFLRAVLTNDLQESFARADDENIIAIQKIVIFIYNFIPASAHGSHEKVKRWLENRVLEVDKPKEADSVEPTPK